MQDDANAITRQQDHKKDICLLSLLHCLEIILNILRRKSFVFFEWKEK